MEKEKIQQLKDLLARETELRNKFPSVRATVIAFIDELNTHDKEWQNFWKEDIGPNSTGRFSNKDKIIILQQPKNLYKNEIYVEGIFFEEECSILEYVEEDKPIFL
jgi:hypothetical protein